MQLFVFGSGNATGRRAIQPKNAQASKEKRNGGLIKMSEEFEGIGIIEEKIEAMSKKGAYWKYKIILEGKGNPNTFNFFDYEAGSKVKTGDKVKVYWYENEGEYEGQPITYRNVRSIFKVNGDFQDPVLSKKSDTHLAKEEKEADENIGDGKRASPSPPPASPAKYVSYSEGARFGMTLNNSVALCIAENKTTIKDIEERFYLFKQLVDKLEG